MNLYRLTRLDATSYEEVLGFVIAAESEAHARALPFIVWAEGNFDGCRCECGHIDPYLIDEDETQPPCAWVDPARTACELIGTAATDVTGVVLRSKASS